jgi:hypothetical protein
MPTIYEARCSSCDYASSHCPEGYLAVVVDEPSSSMHVHPAHNRIVILGHPLEAMILEELGLSFETAALTGRLLYIHNVVCSACGTMYEIRRIGASSSVWGCSGCFVILGVSACCGVIAGWASESFWLGCLAGWLVFAVISAASDWSLDAYVRSRSKERVRESDRAPGCPHCGEKRYAAFRPRWRALPCPKCRQHTVKVRSVGIS